MPDGKAGMVGLVFYSMFYSKCPLSVDKQGLDGIGCDAG